MKEVALVAYDLGRADERGLLVNATVALRGAGFGVRALVKGVDDSTRGRLEGMGAEVVSLGFSHSPKDKALEHEFAATSRKASELVGEADACLVLDEEAVMFSAFKRGPTAFWSQGPFFLSALQGRLGEYGPLAARLFEIGLARCASKYGGHLRAYDAVAANSEACAVLLRYSTGRVTDAVIYPPVDPASCPDPQVEKSGGRVLIVGDRDERDIAEELRKIRAGTETGDVEFPEAPGVVSGEPCPYAGASFTVVDYPFGLFSYAGLQSMLCGTPVLTYAHGGLAELIAGLASPPQGVFEAGETAPGANSLGAGWLVSTRQELLREATRLVREGYPAEVRRLARERALSLSVERIAPSLVKLLQLAVERATADAGRRCGHRAVSRAFAD